MTDGPSFFTLPAEGCAELLSRRLRASQEEIARQWLDRLNALLPVERNDVFPSVKLLDYIPEIISAIADYLLAPVAEEIGANTSVIAKATELGLLRYEQRASVHQLLRESDPGRPAGAGRRERTGVRRRGDRRRLRPARDEPRRQGRPRPAAADQRHLRREVHGDDRPSNDGAARVQPAREPRDSSAPRRAPGAREDLARGLTPTAGAARGHLEPQRRAAR